MYLIGNQESAGVELYITAERKLEFGVWRKDGSGYERVTGKTTVDTDTIYHVTAIYDGKTSYLYVNNKLEGTLETDGGMVNNPPENIHMLIGANPTTDSNGKIDIHYLARLAKMKLYRAEVYALQKK